MTEENLANLEGLHLVVSEAAGKNRPAATPEAEEQEQELLDGLTLPGMQDEVQTRKINWMKLPRRVRRALRRLHHMVGHKPISVMKVIMKAGGVPVEDIRGLKYFK